MVVASLSARMETFTVSNQKDQLNLVNKLVELESKMDSALETIVMRLDRMESSFGSELGNGGNKFGQEENVLYGGHPGYLPPMGRGVLRPNNGYRSIQPRFPTADAYHPRQ